MFLCTSESSTDGEENLCCIKDCFFMKPDPIYVHPRENAESEQLKSVVRDQLLKVVLHDLEGIFMIFYFRSIPYGMFCL